jgi:hypothetical protein
MQTAGSVAIGDSGSGPGGHDDGPADR